MTVDTMNVLTIQEASYNFARALRQKMAVQRIPLTY